MNNINLLCPLNSLGYGITSYNIWQHLKTLADITLFPIGQIAIENHWDQSAILECIKNQYNYNPKSPCLKIWHPHDLLMKPHGTGSYVTYSFFESDYISNAERVGYNNSDIIIVPTQWAKNILVKNHIDETKIRLAPPGVDTTIFDYNIPVSQEDLSDDYVFINIGKWELRKGHDILVDVFNQAFEPHDNVRLLMINTNPFISAKENHEWQNLYKNSKLKDKIYIISSRLSSQMDIAKAISISNCGIYPARAEGWNNEAIETMAMNKPVILTNYSGHTEYANSTNSYLIETETLESAIDNKFFHGDGQWAKLDSNALEQTVEHMRHVYKNHITTNPNGLKTAQQFSWRTTAQKIMDIIYE
jgi:glycosyltransferase involved in cell wall biosynthesis